MSEQFNYNESVKNAIVSNLVEQAFKSILPLFKRRNTKKAATKNKFDFEAVILEHFNEMYNWSKELEFIGLGGKPISTITNSIELEYSYSLRRKRNQEINSTSPIKESDFIFSEGNIILEGDPGSGKTTTLKRLLYQYFFSPKKVESQFSYPILIRFRAIELEFNLYTYISTLLGINYETMAEEFQVKVKKTRIIIVKGENIEEEYEEFETHQKYKYFINSIAIEVALIKLLEENTVLIIMDGLDELKPDLFQIFQTQLKEISLKLFYSKIILTSRPGYIKIAYPNFSIYQVSPLSNFQMEFIVKLWLNDFDHFLSELKPKSYYELANRPLFLSFLILLYKENQSKGTQTLPKFSKDVYEQILELLVLKWDKERTIRRKSKYSEFDEKGKLKFLSHLSYRLTYKIKEKIFSHEQLVDSYLQICPFFDLPENEAELVSEEIENHTGIILKSLYNKYEFSHLAIQEYLCALYILGAPFNDKIKNYLLEYPSPLAFAVAISNAPSLWLSELILKMLTISLDYDNLAQMAAQILNRLNIESPYFENHLDLAISLMTLCRYCNCNHNFSYALRSFILQNKNVENSIAEILKNYSFNIRSEKDNRITYRKKNDCEFKYPETVALPMSCDLFKIE